MKLTPLVKRLSIQRKDLAIARLEPNWAQQRYLETAERQLETTGRIRIIVLKARQLGISTITEAMAFSLSFAYPRYRTYIVAHEVKASQNLLAMTKLYWDTYPFKSLYSTNYLSRNDVQWVETGSSMAVSTAGNKGTGRSATIHFLHASEFAFWPDPAVVMLGLRQTIPNVAGTGIVIESTANGVGNLFHRMWQEAEAGDSEYAALFFPWHEHPEYLASATNLPYFNLGNLDDEERNLQRKFNLSDDRLAWRRWAIKNLCDNDIEKFHQEYPSDPDEAFIASGTNVFPYKKLTECYDPQPGYKGYLDRNGLTARFIADPQGPMTIFKTPSHDDEYGVYLIAGDPTRTTQGDFACAQIINRRTLEQVAEWRGRIDPGTFAEELFKIGLYYNRGLLSSEVEGPGYLTVGKLLGMNYPYIYQRTKVDKTPGKQVSGDLHGWSTSVQTKELMIGWLLKCVMDNAITIHSRILFQEMRDYVRLDSGGYGPATDDGFDDTVMAMAQAVVCHMTGPPILPYGSMSDYAPPPDGDGPDDPTNALPVQLPWERWNDIEQEQDA